MNGMWSDKKYINYIINALLFLASINFLHYGQIFIALMCAVLFIDNKCKIKVNNIKIFIVLILFGLAFFAFSYKLGIYSVFGFFLPMAYYIGSNLRNTSFDSIKKVIYIIAFGMAFYIVLNFAYIVYLFGGEFYLHLWQYDVWLKQKISPTTISTSMVMIIVMSYYLLHFEKNRILKTIGDILFIFVLFFDIKLGRRSPFALAIIINVFGFVLDTYIYKTNTINKRTLTIIASFLFVLFGIISTLYYFDIGSVRFYIDTLGIVNKIKNYGIDPGRLEIFVEAIKYMPSHILGGQEISEILGIQIHDLWFDIYDYAGIVPFIFMIVYTISVIMTIIKIITNKEIEEEKKILVLLLSIGIALEMLIEPIMTGSSLLLICSIIIFTLFEII